MLGGKNGDSTARPASSRPVALCAQPIALHAGNLTTNWTTLDQLVADARADITEDGRRLIAIWSGLQAVRVGVDFVCPFTDAEPDLIAGFLRGVELGLKPRWREGRSCGRPTASRVPTGRLWAFDDHPTMAEIMFEERYVHLGEEA